MLRKLFSVPNEVTENHYACDVPSMVHKPRTCSYS